MERQPGILINVENKPVEEKHICWFTRRHSENNRPVITLCRVVERGYTHPDSDGQALIHRFETDNVKTLGVNDYDASSLKLLEHSINTIDQLFTARDTTCKHENLNFEDIDEGDTVLCPDCKLRIYQEKK